MVSGDCPWSGVTVSAVADRHTIDRKIEARFFMTGTSPVVEGLPRRIPNQKSIARHSRARSPARQGTTNCAVTSWTTVLPTPPATELHAATGQAI
jgi:hypothetical protein